MGIGGLGCELDCPPSLPLFLDLKRRALVLRIVSKLTTVSFVSQANGFTVWLPVVRPETESEAMAKTATVLAFLGGTLFEIGAYLGLLEAGNRGKHSDCKYLLFATFDNESALLLM